MKGLFSTNQKLKIFFLLFTVAEGLFLNSILTIQIVAGLLGFIYLSNVVFNLITIANNLSLKKRIIHTFTPFSILCPLTKSNTDRLTELTEYISKIEDAKDRLQVILLVKEKDTETLGKIEEQLFPKFFKGVVVPSEFKSRSKAVSYGLSYATHDQAVIYDPYFYNLNQNLFIRIFAIRSVNPFFLFTNLPV